MKESKQRDIASFFGGKPLEKKPKAPAAPKAARKAEPAKPATRGGSDASPPATDAAAPAAKPQLKRLRKAGDAAPAVSAPWQRAAGRGGQRLAWAAAGRSWPAGSKCQRACQVSTCMS